MDIEAQLRLRSTTNPTQTFIRDTSRIIDREEYDTPPGEVLLLALFRLFLEPLGVAVETWSMSVQSDEAPSDRNRTYTFGDLFLFLRVYVRELEAKLTAAVGGDTTCNGLSAASIKQYVRRF